MDATDKVFAGSIPGTLRPLSGPAHLRALCARPCRPDRRRISRGDVLETAAGTGVLTRALASRLRSRTCASSRPISTSRCSIMPRRSSLPIAGIDWRQADALALPFEDRSFDVVACQFGAMFFPDKVQGYREARRVLKPGGHFFFNVWDRDRGERVCRRRDAGTGRNVSERSAAFLARTPHGYHDVEAIRAELKAAGFDGCIRRYGDGTIQGALAAASRGRLLPGNAAAKRNRGARCIAAGARPRKRPPKRCSAASAAAPSTAASRLTSLPRAG